ncbi:MAG TPA: carboxypeptidase-like regulatory domain-containing protein [Acidobacteriota bacterium]
MKRLLIYCSLAVVGISGLAPGAEAARGVLKGRVFGPGGDPATDASLVLTSAVLERLFLVTSARTDGHYAFGDLEPGSYKLCAYLQGIGFAERNELTVRPPFAALADLELNATAPANGPFAPAPAPSRFHGHISDARGKDFAGAIARLLDADGRVVEIATTDENGRFHFMIEPNGRYAISTELTGYVPLFLHGLHADPDGPLYGRFIFQPKVFAFKTKVEEQAPEEELPLGGPERPLPANFHDWFPPDDDDCDEPPRPPIMGPPEIHPPPGPPPHGVRPPQ